MTEPCDLSAVDARRLIGLSTALPRRAAGELPAAHRADQRCRQRHRRHGRRRGAQARPRPSRRRSAAARSWACWRAFPSASRTCRRRPGSARPGARCCSRTTCRPRTSRRRQHPQGRRHRPRQDQHAEFGAGANTTNRVYGPTGNPFDPIKTCGGLVRRLGRGAGARPGAARHRLRLRRQPAHAGRVLRRGRLPPVARRGARASTARRPPPVLASLGPMGRTVEDAHLLLRAQIGQDKRDPFSSGDGARIPARLIGADLGRACASPSRPISAARRSTRRSPPSSGARQASSAVRSARCEERAPDFDQRARRFRDPSLRLLRRPRTASGWRRRAICSTATSSTTPSAACKLSLPT